MKPVKYEELKPGDIIRREDQILNRGIWRPITEGWQDIVGFEYTTGMKKMRRVKP